MKQIKKMPLRIIQVIGLCFLMMTTGAHAQSSTCTPACSSGEVCCVNNGEGTCGSSCGAGYYCCVYEGATTCFLNNETGNNGCCALLKIQCPSTSVCLENDDCSPKDSCALAYCTPSTSSFKEDPSKTKRSIR